VSHRIAMLCGSWAILVSNFAVAEVFQCVDAGGRILLTDGGCPSGYNVNLIVGEPRSAEDDAIAYREEADQRLAVADAERRAAEAEAARLRAALEAQRMHEGSQQDRIDALDRKLDTLLDRPQVYGGTALVPVPALPWCGATGRPWVDCRPRPKPQAFRPEARDLRPKAQVHRPEARDRCGTFGCTPGITHAPWDDERRLPDHWPERFQRR
jgi:hypothetical protein